MKYYYTYKITLLKGSLAGHYYFGQHTTNNLNDGYAGSGKIVNHYYSKYGAIEHRTYIKEIIAFYNCIEDLNQAEYELIGDKYNTDKYCLNLRAGGMQAGFNEETKRLISEKTKEAMTPEVCKKVSERTKTAMQRNDVKKKLSENNGAHKPEVRKKLSESHKGNKNPMYGKHRSDETKKKIGDAQRGRTFKKYSWLTPDGDIVLMNKRSVKQYHKDWILIK